MKYKKKTVCIQGKGHSGTRLFADTLDQSGIFMGQDTKRRHKTMQNFRHIRSDWKFIPDTMDKGPYGHINEIYNISLPFVSQRSFSDWDFSKMSNGDIPRSVKDIYTDYLSDIENSNNDFVGWKIELEQGDSHLNSAQQRIAGNTIRKYYVPKQDIDYPLYSFLNYHMAQLNYSDWFLDG